LSGEDEFEPLIRRTTVSAFETAAAPRVLHRESVFRWTPAEDVAQADNVGGVYQGSTRLSSQVTVSHLQSEPLHDLIEAALPDVYGDRRVQSLLVCDPEDLELLMGMVEGGASLTDLLDRRQRGPYAKLELTRWVFEDPASPGERRPSHALERWERVTGAVRDVLQLEE
jgi:hypothetical protein